MLQFEPQTMDEEENNTGTKPEEETSPAKANNDDSRQEEGKNANDSTRDGEKDSFLAPLPPASPRKSKQSDNKSATMTSTYSTNSASNKKSRTIKKTAINAVLMDAADSDDETPLKYQITRSHKIGKGSTEADGKEDSNAKYIEFLSRFCKQCKRKKTMYQSMGRLLNRIDVFALLVPLFIFGCILSVVPLLIGYSELKGASDSSSCGGSKGMLVVTTLFGILTLSWLALRQSLSLTKMSSDYERMAMNYTHLANHIRSVQVQLQSSMSEASIELVLHHLDKFHQQVRQERDSLSKAPRWVRKRFTDLIVEEERERDMQRAEQQEHNIGGIGFD